MNHESQVANSNPTMKWWERFVNMKTRIISTLKRLNIFLMVVHPSIKIIKISWISATIRLILIWKQNGIFFAISNQKSAVDRIGGTRNHLTARTSLYRPCNNQILSAEAVFTNFRKKNVLFSIKRDYFNLLWDK